MGTSVMASTGSGFSYEGTNGEVIGIRTNVNGKIEYQVEFPMRVYTPAEIERGDDYPGENIHWLFADEVTA